jgi:uncharacterized membrane protein
MQLTHSADHDERETVFAGTSIHPAVIAVWAAIIATGNMLPTIPFLGMSGTFTISVAFVPLAGILFGPVAGAVCAAVGAFIAQLIAPHTAWLGLATFLIATINAAAVGLITRGRWYLTAGIIGIGYGLWFLTPIGVEAALFPAVFYTLGLLATVIGAFVWRRLAVGPPRGVVPVALLAVGTFVASYAGFVSAAGIANFAGIMLYNWPAAMWMGLTVVAPIERAVFSLAATLVGIPLMLGLPKIGVRVGLAAIRSPFGGDARARRESGQEPAPRG